MSQWHAWIADVDARPEEAAALGERLTRWLVEERIVLPEPDPESVLGGGTGHRPGPGYGRAVVEEYGWLADSQWNGLSVRVGRQGYECNEVSEVRCPVCRAGASCFEEGPDGVVDPSEELPEPWDAVAGAAYAWLQDDGPDSAACPACGARVRFADWEFGDAPIAVAHVGLVMWNWAEPSAWFLDGVSRRLGGHRLVSGMSGG